MMSATGGGRRDKRHSHCFEVWRCGGQKMQQPNNSDDDVRGGMKNKINIEYFDS